MEIVDEIPLIKYSNEYDYVSFVGSGGTAGLHKVRRYADGQFYVMKIMKKSAVDEDDLIAEFNMRLLLQDSCRSGLTCYHDLFKTKFMDRACYGLIMDYIEGQELMTMLLDENNYKYLTDAHKLKITNDLIEIVKKLQENFLVHRDISPENLMYQFNPDPDRSRLTLIDYGGLCSSDEKDPKNWVKYCNRTTAAYKDEYLAPEIKVKMGTSLAADIDWIKGDIWATGVTIWTLWFREPYRGYPKAKNNLNQDVPINIRNGLNQMLKQSYEIRAFPKNPLKISNI